ncbi:MAG: Na+/glucose cotransporter, partial [Bacteroidales bacterium]
APNWLHYEIIIFFIVIALMIIVSMVTPKPEPAAIQSLYFGSATAEQKAETRASWNKWDIINTAIIVGVIIVFYIYFW